MRKVLKISKGVFNRRKYENEIKYNGKKKKKYNTNSGPQNITQKTKDLTTRNTPQTGIELKCSRKGK
jgi:hypothetical protein